MPTYQAGIMEGLMQRKQNQCHHCGVTTWNQDYTGFMRDHDRPDGRRCQKAAKEYAVAKEGKAGIHEFGCDCMCCRPWTS